MTKRYVQRANAAADRSRERTFDTYQKLLESCNCFIRQPGLVAHFLTKHVKRFFTGVDFHPTDFFFAAVGLFDSSIKNPYRSLPDINTGTVTFDVGYDRVVRHIQLTIGTHGDLTPSGDSNIRIRHQSLLRAR